MSSSTKQAEYTAGLTKTTPAQTLSHLKRPPLKHKSRWHGNADTRPSKTLRLRSETICNAAHDTTHAQAQRINLRLIEKSLLAELPMARQCCPRNHGHFRTLSSALRPQASRPANMSYTQTPLSNGKPSLRIREKHRFHKQANTPKHKQTNTQTQKTIKHTNTQTQKTNKQTNKQTKNKQTNKQTDTQTAKRQTTKQINKQTNK